MVEEDVEPPRPELDWEEEVEGEFDGRVVGEPAEEEVVGDAPEVKLLKK